ncbi:hypothetical protein [uncultured Cohaesibacter sp.]|uniref:hypothetical protein n=1 Tax=uncultured Cohaesibacter sp. TaxID=1002546 RepID=UPI00292EDDF0|nr:hypothetical protein [uncultured Cohaesibacter sp.]
MTYDPEIEKLLPWYEKGLLDPDERDRVSAYLDAHPDMRSQLVLIAEEAEAVERQHAALGAPQAGGLDRLLADIDVIEARKAPISGRASGLLSGMRRFFSSISTPSLRLAGVAAALIIVVQAIVIGGLLTSDPDPSGTGARFVTASGPKANASQNENVFLIAFSKTARMDAIVALLESKSARLISGPKAGGFFEIAIAEANLPEGGAKSVLADLKANKELVRFVSLSQ